MGKTWFLSLLADACGKAGRPEVGLEALSEAFEFLTKTNERAYEAELYRLKGELTLQPKVQGRRSKAIDRPLVSPHVQGEAESCFLKSVDIAQKQHAKSWELRATMSLVRLRRQQATQPESRALQRETRTKLEEARIMLADVYNWFTEGFDTRDLQHAKALLEE